jgi:hypothetical protein
MLSRVSLWVNSRKPDASSMIRDVLCRGPVFVEFAEFSEGVEADGEAVWRLGSSARVSW